VSKLEPAQPVLVLSPHLDDAVLSCGHFLYANPSTTVVTVLAGAPEIFHEGYNSKTTGKPYAPDAISVRRDEDRKAVEYLGATPVWLDLLDADYGEYRPPRDYVDVIHDEIARELDETRPASIFAPLGLMHSDHLAVSDACIELAVNSPVAWYLYMDLPYGLANRRVLLKRLATLSQHVQLVEFDSHDGEPGIKERAVRLYASQYDPTRRNFRKSFDATMRGGERFWRVETLS
jgi:LmbE family N-acetylglucosaminyl deacetylase